MSNPTTPDSSGAEQALQQTSDSVQALADKVQHTVHQTQARLGELQEQLMDKTKSAAQSTDAYVHERPWTAIAAGVGAGFLLGLLLGRR